MTGAVNPLIDPLASGLVDIVLSVAKQIGGNLFQSFRDKKQAYSALKKYEDKYAVRNGSIKLLGMQQHIPLGKVYIKVNFLDDISIRRFESLTSLERGFRNSSERRFQNRKRIAEDGLEVANGHQYLTVLGGPGAGKSTFLRRLGLEALKGEKGKYQYRCIPIFLELKRYNPNKRNLKELIQKELSYFGFPSSEQFADKALEQGHLLLLLDGLDEVPKQYFNNVLDEIDNLVTHFEKNRFILSCRIASYKSSLNGFRDIELSDFDDQQIETFIYNWFQSDSDKSSDVAKKCWHLLKNVRNQSAKELAQTPLLLTFLCLVYGRTLRFPSNRSELYNKALDILLEEWAAEKRVEQDEVYQGLHMNLEKVMLSEIAYRGILKDKLFFRENNLVKQITAFLSDTVDNPEWLDGKKVLETIAAQQGIFVERAEGVYSFSHLTIQEYLTARYISQNGKIKELVEKYFDKSRWREVFLLVSGLLDSSDTLLEMLEKAINNIDVDPELQRLLSWINSAIENSTPLDNQYKIAAKRAYALSILVVTPSSDDSEKYPNSFRDLVKKSTLPRQIDVLNASGLSMAIARSLDPKLGRNYIKATQKLMDIESEKGSFIIHAKPNQFNLIDNLSKHVFGEELAQEISERQSYSKFNKVFIEKTILYLTANLLLVECKNASVRVSRKVWTRIEDRILLPRK